MGYSSIRQKNTFFLVVLCAPSGGHHHDHDHEHNHNHDHNHDHDHDCAKEEPPALEDLIQDLGIQVFD